jgi:hypothetical protein
MAADVPQIKMLEKWLDAGAGEVQARVNSQLSPPSFGKSGTPPVGF